MLIKEYKLPFMRWVSSEDQIYSMMTIVYNTVLCVRKLPCVCVCVCVCAQLCLTLRDLMNSSPQVPLSMEFSRQEYCSGLPFSTPGDLPSPGLKPVLLGLLS